MTPRPAFAPWDVRTAPRIVSSDESARRLRIFAAVETRLADALQTFAGVIAEDHAKGSLARHAKRHEWHADLFRSVLADADGSASPDAAIEDADIAAIVDAVLAPAGADRTVEFLTGVYRVLLPRQITAYTYFVRALGGDAADADERWFGFVLQDAYASIRDGELLLQSLLAGADEVQRSADRRAELEAMFVNAGGLVGPDSLGAQSASNRPKENAR